MDDLAKKRALLEQTFSNPDTFYIKEGRIGEGAYGVVFIAREREGKKYVAIKRMKATRNGEGIPLHTYHEIKILKELNNDNIIKLEKVFMRPAEREVDLVYDYAEHDLADIIRYHRRQSIACDSRVVKSLLYQVLSGLAYLHKNWIMHRDIKPANILVMGKNSGGDQFGRVKIADFGLARIFQSPMRPLFSDGEVVTIWYRAPELLLGCKHYTKAIDIWAVGCIFAELLIWDAIFPGKEAKGFQKDQLKRIFEVLGKPTVQEWEGLAECPHYAEMEKMNQDFRYRLADKVPVLQDPRNAHAYNLLQNMLLFDPAKRITAEQALSHHYFREAPFPDKNAFMTCDEREYPYPIRTITTKKPAVPAGRGGFLPQSEESMPPPPGGRGRGKGRGKTRGTGARGGRGGRRGRGRGSMNDIDQGTQGNSFPLSSAQMFPVLTQMQIHQQPAQSTRTRNKRTERDFDGTGNKKQRQSY